MALFYSDFAKQPDFDVPSDFNLRTVHRAENTDDNFRLAVVLEALNLLPEKCLGFSSLSRNAEKFRLLDMISAQGSPIEPVGYLEMLWLLKNSQYVLTDGGGLQKEAFFFRKTLDHT